MSDKQLSSRQKAILGSISWGADYALRDFFKIFDSNEAPLSSLGNLLRSKGIHIHYLIVKDF